MKGIRLFLIYIVFVLLGCVEVSRIPQDMYLANQGFVELSNGNYLRAEANLLVALDLNPNNPYALLNLGAVYQDTARTAEAVQMYKRIIELNPEEGAVESNKQGYEGKTLVEIARENLSGLGVILAERGSPIDLTEMENSSDIVSNDYFQSLSDTATRHSSAFSVADQQNSISLAGGGGASGGETSGIGASAGASTGTVSGGESGSDSGSSGGYDSGGGTGGASQGGEGGSGGGVGAGGGGSGGSSGEGGTPGSGSSASGVGGGASDGASGGNSGGNAGGNR